MNEQNLPIEVRNKQLAVQKRKNKRTIEGIKRAGKIALNVGISLAGYATIGIGGPIAVVGGGVYVVAAVKAVNDGLIHPISKDSMFVKSKKMNGETVISQGLNNFSKMKGFHPAEKGAMMGLDLLVQLKNIKQQYQDESTITEEVKDGENNVYPQIYSTVTHGINIDTVEALEQLGYIQIERKEPKQKSILFFEKMFFGQYDEAKKALLSKFIPSKRKEYEKQMFELAFKITDKPMDFEKIYKEYMEVRQTKDKSEKGKALRRVGTLFAGLRNRKIDIQTNEVGETIIAYNAAKSFVHRMERESGNSSKAFRDNMYIGDQCPVSPKKEPATQEIVLNQDGEAR